MLKFAVALTLLAPQVSFAVTDAQSYFMATAKVYNARLSKSTWLQKMKTQVAAEELKPLEDSLVALKDDQLLSAVQRDRTTLAFVNLEGKTLATLKMNDEGKITINDQELNLESHTGFKAQYEYLKTLVPQDIADASLLKFHQHLNEGASTKTIAKVETENSEDAQTLKAIIANMDIKRLDISCSAGESDVSAYLVKKYKVGKDSQIATKDDRYLVQKLSLHLLDEYDEPYEERIEVVQISPAHEVKFTKPTKKKKGAKTSEASQEIRLMEVWGNGSLIRKNQLIQKSSSDAEVTRAKALLKCCQDMAKSCLDRLR